MEEKVKNNWWNEDYGFFGGHYHLGDHSREGYNVKKRMNYNQRTQKEIEFIISFLNPRPNSSFLDCPCGSGRHSYALAEKGYNVTGVDINLKMLSYQKDYFKTKESKLKIQQMDMRNLKFKDMSFDYVINMFISFGFFNDNDNKKVASEFYRVLNKDGKLLIHLDINYDNIIRGDFNGMQHVSRNCEYNGKSKLLEITERYNHDTRRLDGEWNLLNGKPEKKEYSLRIYDNEKEFIPLFREVGFKEVSLFDAYTKKAVTPDSIDTILIAIK